MTAVQIIVPCHGRRRGPRHASSGGPAGARRRSAPLDAVRTRERGPQRRLCVRPSGNAAVVLHAGHCLTASVPNAARWPHGISRSQASRPKHPDGRVGPPASRRLRACVQGGRFGSARDRADPADGRGAERAGRAQPAAVDAAAAGADRDRRGDRRRCPTSACELEPEIFFLLFLPPLLFLDGWRIPKAGLLRDKGTILAAGVRPGGVHRARRRLADPLDDSGDAAGRGLRAGRRSSRRPTRWRCRRSPRGGRCPSG